MLARDHLDLSTVNVVHSPDARQWPITTALTQVKFDGSTTRVNFTRKDGPDRWPDVTPPGWDGPLQYTIWLFLNIPGEGWTGAAFVQMWHGREASGSPADPDVPSLYAKNWYYDNRWAPMPTHGIIAQGEPIGFMLTHGNARNGARDGLEERSNLVVFPALDNAVYDFPADDAGPVDPPPPGQPPPPAGGVTLATLHNDLEDIKNLLRGRP